MGRNQKNTIDYFPHSVSHKTTMFILEQKFGNDGYAVWFKLLELLGGSPYHYIDCNKDTTWQYLVAKFRAEEKTVLLILDLLCSLDAIDKELWQHKIIWSDNFINNIEDVYRKRKLPIPQKPSPNGTGKVISVTDINNKQQAEVISVTDINNKQQAEVISVTDINNPTHELVTEIPQSKVKEIKVNEINNPKGDDIQEQDTIYEKLKQGLRGNKNPNAYLANIFHEYLGIEKKVTPGWMGVVCGFVNNDYEKVLSCIWKQACRPVGGIKSNYLHQTVFDEGKKMKLQRTSMKTKTVAEFRKEQGL